MSSFEITFIGPADSAVPVATSLADAEGVDLTSSQPPLVRDDGGVELKVLVNGSIADVTDAVAGIRRAMPPAASIEVAER